MNQPHTHRAPQPERLRSPRRLVQVLRRRRQAGLPPRAGGAWRLLTPSVFVLAGALFVASAINSEGTDLRPGRYADLADLAQQRSDEAAALNERRAELEAEIERLTAGMTNVGIEKANQAIDRLRDPAGLEPVQGPGITVTLTDAPSRVLDDSVGEIGRKIVHQQDIQAVANALWAGGAEAVTVQGQRITSSVGIRCVGNSVLLQGVPYSPPYVISGIGDPQRMLSRIDSDPYLRLYLQDVERFQLGWDVEVNSHLEFPAYTGSTETRFARPAPTAEKAGA